MKLACLQWRWRWSGRARPIVLPALYRRKGPEENLPTGHSLEWTNHMRNVFVEKWPSLVKCLLVAGAALFIFIHWA